MKGQARDGLDLDVGNRASRNPTPAMANTGRRSDTKIERRSWAPLVTSSRIICGHWYTSAPAVAADRRFDPLGSADWDERAWMKTVDVGAAIDEGRWTGYQKLLIVGTALTIILDGVDNQLLPNAVPTLIKEWDGRAAEFINALADRAIRHDDRRADRRHARRSLGRRTALLGSVLAFAVLTWRSPSSNSIEMLGLLRFLAGVGLGGAMPNAATLASEYVPRRQRPFAVTLTIVCIPLGGVIAAELAARVIPVYGWRMLFIARRRDPDRSGTRAVEGSA